jgi:hypothetical protein
MSKYDRLKAHLTVAGGEVVRMTFAEIEELVGGLPASAFGHTAWWSNEDEGGRHVQSKAWTGAGRVVSELDLAARTVTFTRR